MFGFLDDVLDAAVNTAKIVTAPLAMEAALVNTVLEPIAEAADEAVEGIKELTK